MNRRLVALLSALVGAAAAAAVATAAFTEGTTTSGSFAAAPDFYPVLQSVPDVLNGPKEGAQLSATTGDWIASAPTFEYQWRRCDATGGACTDIPAATLASYTPVAADANATVRVRVRAVNGAVGTSAASEPTDTVKSALSDAPTIITMPAIDDTTPALGQTLNVSAGTWSLGAISPQYQWQRCDATGAACADIALATATTYVVQPADQGKRLRAKVSRAVTVTRTTVQTPDTSLVP